MFAEKIRQAVTWALAPRLAEHEAELLRCLREMHLVIGRLLALIELMEKKEREKQDGPGGEGLPG